MEQRQLEDRYDQLMQERDVLKSTGCPQSKLEENDAAIEEVTQQLKRSTQTLCQNLRQNPSATENMVKLQSERRFVLGMCAWGCVLGCGGGTHFL